MNPTFSLRTRQEKARAPGLEIQDPGISMITPGGGGVHRICQALKRDPG